MSKHEGIPENKGWHFLIDGPLKNKWTPIQYPGAPSAELELVTDEGTLAKYVRFPTNDAPGIFTYKFEGELSSI